MPTSSTGATESSAAGRSQSPPPEEEVLAELAGSFHATYISAEELAQAFVREAIMRGIYRPGDRLSQDAIASTLGISRIPVRAGLRLLEAEGLLTIYPHRGARVSILTVDEVKEVYELRTLLECFLMDLSIRSLTDEHLTELRELADRLESSSDASDGVSKRMAFYERLYSLADRPRILRLVTRLHAEVGQYLLTHRASDDPSGHLGLLPHLERRDIGGAQAWLRQHLAEVSAELQGVVAKIHAERDGENGSARVH